jgi:hypothetical protein
VDRALDAGALERDCPGLMDFMTLGVSFFHQRDPLIMQAACRTIYLPERLQASVNSGFQN